MRRRALRSASRARPRAMTTSAALANATISDCAGVGSASMRAALASASSAVVVSSPPMRAVCTAGNQGSCVQASGFETQRGAPTRWCQLNPIVLQNPRNRRAAQVQAKVHQCAAKPRVPPRGIFASHRQQLPDPVVGRAGTACRGSGRTAVVLGRDLLAVPTHDRLGRRQHATSASRFRPSALPFSARRRRSASVKRSRFGLRRPRSTRFSARKYSIASPC
jgi:hypothetical protein